MVFSIAFLFSYSFSLQFSPYRIAYIPYSFLAYACAQKDLQNFSIKFGRKSLETFWALGLAFPCGSSRVAPRGVALARCRSFWLSLVNGLNFACIVFSRFGGVLIRVCVFRGKIGAKFGAWRGVVVVCSCRFCLVALFFRLCGAFSLSVGCLLVFFARLIVGRFWGRYGQIKKGDLLALFG